MTSMHTHLFSTLSGEHMRKKSTSLLSRGTIQMDVNLQHLLALFLWLRKCVQQLPPYVVSGSSSLSSSSHPAGHSMMSSTGDGWVSGGCWQQHRVADNRAREPGSPTLSLHQVFHLWARHFISHGRGRANSCTTDTCCCQQLFLLKWCGYVYLAFGPLPVLRGFERLPVARTSTGGIFLSSSLPAAALDDASADDDATWVEE